MHNAPMYLTTLVASNGPPAWLTYISLGLSIVAFFTSMGWGIYTWRRNRDVLVVSGDIRAPFFHNRRRPVRAGELHTVLTLTANNRGRSPVRVHNVYLASKEMNKRSKFSLTEGSDPVPHWIEARDRARWYVTPETVGVLAKQYGNPLVVRPLLEYGPDAWKRGRLLRIKVGEGHLPGHAPRFKSDFGYWFRTLRRRKGAGSYKISAGEAVVSRQNENESADDGTQ